MNKFVTLAVCLPCAFALSSSKAQTIAEMHEFPIPGTEQQQAPQQQQTLPQMPEAFQPRRWVSPVMDAAKGPMANFQPRTEPIANPNSWDPKAGKGGIPMGPRGMIDFVNEAMGTQFNPFQRNQHYTNDRSDQALESDVATERHNVIQYGRTLAKAFR
eukprot:gnl/MRDRNA2_/MRDRNA2_87583_c0_seq1.p1 gnl/MRDRNA2_/MRDRNA2_87583_c0~~gnl/MRDRNA2_/MRDRNA2_87583_c0_seq1.p1  ORF type:complete len:158 (-),score=18.02 gnl/MRDRNA2_/MRDRNA2_87583_c0_seq1:49-522(-)